MGSLIMSGRNLLRDFPPNLQPQVNEKLAVEVAGTALNRDRGLSRTNQACFVPGLQGQWEGGLFT